MGIHATYNTIRLISNRWQIRMHSGFLWRQFQNSLQFTFDPNKLNFNLLQLKKTTLLDNWQGANQISKNNTSYAVFAFCWSPNTEHKRTEHIHYVVFASDDHQITKEQEHSTRIAEITKLHLHHVLHPWIAIMYSASKLCYSNASTSRTASALFHTRSLSQTLRSELHSSTW